MNPDAKLKKADVPMIRNAKDLSPEQRTAIETLLGRDLLESEDVSVRTISPAPPWLQEIWRGAKERGLDRLTEEDVQAEIDAYRREKRQKSPEDFR